MDKNKSTGLNQIYNVILDLAHQWQIIIFVCVTCALGFDTYMTITYAPIYRCEATFAVNTGDSGSVQDGDSDVGETFTYIFSSNIFKKQIQEALNVEVLNGSFSAELYEGTSVLYVYADSPAARTSYDMMNALINNYQDISNLVVGNSNIDLLKEITVPAMPYNQLNHQKNILLAGVIGLVGIVALLVFSSLSKDTIKNKYEIESKLMLRLLGSLPRETKLISFLSFKRKKAILVSQFTTSFHYVEAFKKIRARVERYCQKYDAKVIMVTSSLENEGKSSVAVNLALSLGMNNHKVLLVDGDLRKPSNKLIFDYEEEPMGIDDFLINNVDLKKIITKLDNYQIDVIFGKGTIENIDEQLNSKKMKTLLETVKKEYDYIIVDSAPASFLSDSNILSTLVDGILLVVKQNYANTNIILNTIERLNLSSTKIIGCINNQSFSVGIGSGKYYGYKYGYNHYYGHRRREQKNG